MTSILAIVAHPDDESFLFGGTLGVHAAAGGRAALVCFTDGQAGRTGGLAARADLGTVRRAELLRAAHALGIDDVVTPGWADGALDEVGDEAGAAFVRAQAERVGADVLLTFGPEGASGHADHKACHRWTLAAAGGRRVYVASFPEELPVRGGAPLPATHVVELGAFDARKRAAFREHRTQQDHLDLFDRMREASGGREWFHRVRPPATATASGPDVVATFEL